MALKKASKKTGLTVAELIRRAVDVFIGMKNEKGMP